MSTFKFVLIFGYFFLKSLFVLIEYDFFFFELFFNVHDFFFFTCKLPTNFNDFLTKFIFQVYKFLFSSVKISWFLSNFGFESGNSFAGCLKFIFTFSFFSTPFLSNLFNSFDLLLFQMNFEFSLFWSFPHFKFPNNLIIGRTLRLLSLPTTTYHTRRM
jgi:hypothetical protein